MSTVWKTQKECVFNILAERANKRVELPKIIHPFSFRDERNTIAHHQQVIHLLRKEWRRIENKTENIIQNGRVAWKHSRYRLVVPTIEEISIMDNGKLEIWYAI